MANNPTTAQFFAGFHDAHGYMGCAMSAPFSGARYRCIGLDSGFIVGLAQGNTVPISRGSPPPKKR